MSRKRTLAMVSDSEDDMTVVQQGSASSPLSLSLGGDELPKEPQKSLSSEASVAAADAWVQAVTTAFSQTHEDIGKQGEGLYGGHRMLRNWCSDHCLGGQPSYACRKGT